MSDREFNYYDLLGVRQTATTAEIKRAYHAAVARYHPDVNSAPNATQITAMLNVAWATLRDPARRAAYDAGMLYETREPGSVDSSEAWELIACMRCGQSDETLRVSAFMFVVSLIFVSWRVPRAGIFCVKCRSAIAWQTALATVFLGWWSLWGFFFSLQALYYAIIGGASDKAINSHMLIHQGAAFWQRNRLDEALSCFVQGNRVANDPRVADAIEELLRLGANGRNPVNFTRGQAAALAFVVLPILIIFFSTILPGTSDENGSSAGPQPVDTLAEQHATPSAADRCQSLTDAKNYSVALTACNEAIQADSTDASNYDHRCTVKRELGDYSGAIADCSKAISLDSNDTYAFNERCLAHDERGEFQAALRDCDVVVSQDPSNAIGWNNRCMVNADLGNFKAALGDCDHALSIEPNEGHTLGYLCSVELQMGNAARAISYCHKAVSLDPNEPRAYVWRSLVYAALGRPTEAISDLQTAAKLFKQQGDLVSYREAMKTLQSLQH